MRNTQIAKIFETIADILSIQDANPFRIRAYQRAAQTIEAKPEDLEMIYQRKGRASLKDIPGIGDDLADKIEELLTTGKLSYLKELAKEVPPGLIDITGIQGMGPKKTKFVWKNFGVETVEDLEKLAKSGKLDTEKNWGKKSVENVLKGIEAMRLHNERIALPSAYELAMQIVEELKKSKLCTKIEVAGSLRRRKETIGDIDILATGKDVAKIMDVFCSIDLADRVLAKGETKSSIHLSTGINADLRVVDDDVFGAALHYFTGSKEHNIAIRKLGITKGVTINEYGVHKGTAEKKGELLASKTEEDIYAAIGLPYIPPELREDRGEIEAAQKGILPVLIEEEDMKADLHFHSNFSDGKVPLTEMVAGAKERGLTYLAVCDHASPMGMVGGIKEDNIDAYLKMIEDARNEQPDIPILAGAEVDTLEDGSLYLPDDVLKKLDWVIASVHGHFNLPRDAMTKRIIKAIENPYVCAIAHPTTRLLLKRDPIDYDTDAVFEAAAKNNVAMEINASLHRLDLNDVLAKKAHDAGCMITINSDAHHPREFQYQFGISQARRAWLEKKDVLNTKSFTEFNEWILERKN